MGSVEKRVSALESFANPTDFDPDGEIAKLCRMTGTTIEHEIEHHGSTHALLLYLKKGIEGAPNSRIRIPTGFPARQAG
jgi:hypothetical protein